MPLTLANLLMAMCLFAGPAQEQEMVECPRNIQWNWAMFHMQKAYTLLEPVLVYLRKYEYDLHPKELDAVAVSKLRTAIQELEDTVKALKKVEKEIKNLPNPPL